MVFLEYSVEHFFLALDYRSVRCDEFVDCSDVMALNPLDVVVKVPALSNGVIPVLIILEYE
jgi:hypothetical protein